MLIFKDIMHEQAFSELLEQADLSIKEMKSPSELLRRQLGFLYLIALYQEDYETYEGERFYIEAYEELSLVGPTYLLEDNMGKRSLPHEQILLVAKDILRGEEPNIPSGLISLAAYIKQAVTLHRVE